MSVISLEPLQYVHVLNKNTNKKRLVTGPLNLALEDHEKIVSNGILHFIIIPNLHYCVIKNPVEVNDKGEILKDAFGLPKYKWDLEQVRTRNTHKQPFPLYPEEIIAKQCTRLLFVEDNKALLLKATYPFKEGETQRKVGDQWYFHGPNYYVSRQEVMISCIVEGVVIYLGNALHLQAEVNVVDANNVKRKAGEEWLIRNEGFYFPQIGEKIIKLREAQIIDENTALHLKAKTHFTDVYGIQRKAGEEWIVKQDSKIQGSNNHILDVYEEYIDTLSRIILNENSFCKILNPYNEEIRKNDFGKVILIKGPKSFFLNPGESIENNEISKVKILNDNEALLLQAKDDYIDPDGTQFKAGAKWMVKGPIRFIPPIEVDILKVIQTIPLDANEGIYIRDTKTGKIRKHMGSSYLLKPNEVLWEKELSPQVEALYLKDMQMKNRDKTRIVAYKCPFNSVMQIYNMKSKTNRIVFGPDLAVLEPDEEFTLMILSGNTPKISNMIPTLSLKLGPTFSSDIFLVETVDHTRLKLKCSYNWLFNLERGNEKEALKMFTIRNFIGDMCLTLASKIRSYIASLTFEDFHKNSDLYIKKAVFGENDKGEINNCLKYDNCSLVINGVDIQSVIPTDSTTQVLLQKSVSLTIELATKIIEQEYKNKSKIKEQEFKGELEKLKITNEIEYYKVLQNLSKLQVESKIIEKNGLSRAQAEAEKDAILIESKSNVELSLKEKEAYIIESDFELKKKQKINDNDYLYQSENQRIDLKKVTEYDLIEANKFKSMIDSLGPETLVEISKAGPELKAKILSSLNLSGYIVTDGNNPINLFNVANNLVKNN